MSESGPDSLVLNLLRHIRSRVDEHAADMIEVKERLGTPQKQRTSVHFESEVRDANFRFGTLEGGVASLSRRVDRIAGDLERVKRRLDLSDAPTA